MPVLHDTIAALATPVGVSALAVVRVSGGDAARLTAEVFGATPLPRAVTRGDYLDRTGTVLDEVLYTYFPAARSYNGEDILEVSCHGNPLIIQKIVDDLLARGCRAAGPGEFTQRAFVNGRMDLSQAEAVMDLIHARSERALGAANQQLRGALGRRMADLIERLLAVLARVEAYIDFPEEDLPAEDRTLLGEELESISLDNNRLIATNRYGNLLRDGIKTVIVGAPNAGKSSLLNRLVGHERALVSSEPGTTRDFIEERIMVGPHSLRLIDTAGLNSTPGALERRGMDKAIEQLAEADLVLWVIDSSITPLPFAANVVDRLSPASTLLVLNKCDLPMAPEFSTATFRPDLERVAIATTTGQGIEDLIAAIVLRAEAFRQEVGDELIAVNARHAQALATARESLEAARLKLGESAPTELLASDLRSALTAFGEIAGKVDNERMLDHLFAGFCIGK